MRGMHDCEADARARNRSPRRRARAYRRAVRSHALVHRHRSSWSTD